MAFHYEAIDRSGNKEKGLLDAANRAEALDRLLARGLQPFVLVERKGAAKESPAASPKATRPTSGPVLLRAKQVVTFSEELSDLLQAGLQLEPALQSMSERDEVSAIKDVSAKIRDAVREGVPFSEALRQSSPSFGELYCSLAHAGEVSGALPRILSRQARHLRALAEIRSRTSTAVTYPAFLLASGVAVAALFMTHLIPRLAEMLDRSGADIPALARGLIATSEFLRQHGLLLLALAVLCALLLWRLATLERFRPAWHRLCLRLPLTGPLLTTNFHVQYLETLGNLTLNGLPLLRALQLAEATTRNFHLRGKLAAVSAEVADGLSLSRALRRSTVFPSALTDMVRVGEQTGQMGESLERAARRYDRELSEKIARVSEALQPAIIVLMAGLVGTMAYVMISVIYDTIATLRAK